MSYCSDIVLGDLVCVKTWNLEDQKHGWVSPPSDFGIVIEIINVSFEFIFIDYKTRCFDYVVYWFSKEITETLPDIVVEKFSDWEAKQNE